MLWTDLAVEMESKKVIIFVSNGSWESEIHSLRKKRCCQLLAWRSARESEGLPIRVRFLQCGFISLMAVNSNISRNIYEAILTDNKTINTFWCYFVLFMLQFLSIKMKTACWILVDLHSISPLLVWLQGEWIDLATGNILCNISGVQWGIYFWS